MNEQAVSSRFDSIMRKLGYSVALLFAVIAVLAWLVPVGQLARVAAFSSILQAGAALYMLLFTSYLVFGSLQSAKTAAIAASSTEQMASIAKEQISISQKQMEHQFMLYQKHSEPNLILDTVGVSGSELLPLQYLLVNLSAAPIWLMDVSYHHRSEENKLLRVLQGGFPLDLEQPPAPRLLKTGDVFRLTPPELDGVVQPTFASGRAVLNVRFYYPPRGQSLQFAELSMPYLTQNREQATA